MYSQLIECDLTNRTSVLNSDSIQPQLPLPIPRRQFSSICKNISSKASSKLRRKDFPGERRHRCAYHLSSSCSMFLHQTSVEFEKMSPDCLSSLRTWMSSHWNVNVVVHKTRGQYFLFITLKSKSPKGCESRGWIWENRVFRENNEFIHPDLSQIAYYSFLDTLKLVQVKFWLFIWFKFKPHINAVLQKGKLMLADGESLILSFSFPDNFSTRPKPNSEITKWETCCISSSQDLPKKP